MHGFQHLRGEGGGADQRVLGRQPRLVGRCRAGPTHRGADPEGGPLGDRYTVGALSRTPGHAPGYGDDQL